MNVFQAERETIAGKLTAAGVDRVTLDPRAPLPCVLVDAPRGETFARGVWRCEYPVRILTAPPGNVEALTWQLDRLEAVCRTLDVDTFDPETYPRNDTDVPCYTVRIGRDIPNPDC